MVLAASRLSGELQERTSLARAGCDKILRIWTEHVLVELSASVVVIHAADHILLEVRNAAGRQRVRWQRSKAGPIFVHGRHTANIGTAAS